MPISHMIRSPDFPACNRLTRERRPARIARRSLEGVQNAWRSNAFVIGNGSKNPVKRADRNTLCAGMATVRSGFLRLLDDVAAYVVDFDVSPAPAECGHELMAAQVPAGFSSEGEHFIADKVKPKAGRLGPVEIERLNRFLDVRPQLIPRVSLGEDAFGQALGREAAVGIVRHLKHNFLHNLESSRLHKVEQAAGQLSGGSILIGSA
jgi:hypothetical protein